MAQRPGHITWWLRVRFVIDRLVALVLALLLAPAIAFLAVAVHREDGGPALVRVERMGRGFRPFRMWKLRTMKAEREDGTASGVPLTCADDQRITRIGRRLRHWHLDELPQLWNVVMGQMLLFGPRPETPEFVDASDERWQRLLRVPPGIAGPTQMIVNDWERAVITEDPSGLRYRTEVLPVKLAIDQWYVERATPWMDLLVGVALMKRFLPRSRATRMKMRVARELPLETAPVWEWASGTRPSKTPAQELAAL